jgi:restriction endonuclease S subunit
MQTSIVKFSSLNLELRVDAEYYRAEVLDKINLLDKKGNGTLSDHATFIIGPFGSTVTMDQYVPNSSFKYVRNRDINDFIISDDAPAFIPEQVYNKLPQFHIRVNDLLVTVVGTLGKVAIATKKDASSIFSCKSTIIRSKKVDPFYLVAYLNSNVGQLFCLRGARGAIQQGLNLSDLKEIKVFLPTDVFQKSIRSKVEEAFAIGNEAKKLYIQAEQILLSELGFLKWITKQQLSYVKNYSDTQAKERIDAEYYRPIYEEIEKAIKTVRNYARLGDIVTITKCFEPGSEKYQEEGIPFLRVSNLSKYGINNDNQQYISDKVYKELEGYQPLAGEILLSKDATPGIAYYLKDKPVKMIPSSGILRLHIKNKHEIIPEYLTLVLNSVIVQKQMERDVGGSIIDHWRLDQIKDVLIPILPIEQQKKISDKINQSFCDREKSKALLEIAKRGVEMAIEKTEKEAEKWIHIEVEKLNIKL